MVRGRGRGRRWGRSPHHPSVSVIAVGSTSATQSTMAMAALSSFSVTLLRTLLSPPSTSRSYLQTPYYKS